MHQQVLCCKKNINKNYKITIVSGFVNLQTTLGQFELNTWSSVQNQKDTAPRYGAACLGELKYKCMACMCLFYNAKLVGHIQKIYISK